MRFRFNKHKSASLRKNPKRGVGFEEAIELFDYPYCLDRRSDLPEQYRAIGWVGERLITVIFLLSVTVSLMSWPKQVKKK